jgi:hypothetical protein
MFDANGEDATDPDRRLAELFPPLRKHVYYLVNWAVTQRMIYVETPKVGCTLIKRVMQFAECRFDEGALPEDVHDRRTSPLRSPKHDLAGFLAELESEECLTFTFVRNPFSRFLSAYLDKIVGDPAVITKRQERLGIGPGPERPSFDEFVDFVYDQPCLDMDVHWAPQSFLMGWPRVRYDFLGRFERLSEDLESLMAVKGLRYPAGARRLGVSHATGADSKLAAYFSERTRQRVVEIYGDDFSHFGYSTSLPS